MFPFRNPVIPESEPMLMPGATDKSPSNAAAVPTTPACAVAIVDPPQVDASFDEVVYGLVAAAFVAMPAPS